MFVNRDLFKRQNQEDDVPESKLSLDALIIDGDDLDSKPTNESSSPKQERLMDMIREKDAQVGRKRSQKTGGIKQIGRIEGDDPLGRIGTSSNVTVIDDLAIRRASDAKYEDSDDEETKDDMTSKAEQMLVEQGISPMFDPTESKPVAVSTIDYSPDQALNSLNKEAFLKSPVPQGTTMQCYIVRKKHGISKRMYPEYEIFLEKGDCFLMVAKKRSNNKTSNYLISSQQDELDKNSTSYLGKVRGNFVGTEFTIYDNGVNPKKVKADDVVRNELGVILYASNVLGSAGPRKMTTIIPSISGTTNKPKEWKDGSKSGLLGTFRKDDVNNMVCMQNKTPVWNKEVGAYVLNFNGRVTMASVKNFQLTSSDEPDRVILQFGRIATDRFSMDVSYPMSPLQAFGICLSSFDNKLACE
jgi:hypothetical protein